MPAAAACGGGGLGQRDAVLRQAQRHQGLDGGLAAPAAAEAGLEAGLVDQPVLFELDDLLVRPELPELHPAPQLERGDGGEQPAGEPDALHVLVGRDVGDPAHRVPGGLDGDHEEHRDDRVHADAERVGPGRGAVEGDRRGGQQPGRLAQQRERDAQPGQQQVQGEQDADARVDADREDQREIPEALLEGELAHRRVRTREPDRGDEYRTGDHETDEYPVGACQLHRGHPRSLPFPVSGAVFRRPVPMPCSDGLSGAPPGVLPDGPSGVLSDGLSGVLPRLLAGTAWHMGTRRVARGGAKPGARGAPGFVRPLPGRGVASSSS